MYWMCTKLKTRTTKFSLASRKKQGDWKHLCKVSEKESILVCWYSIRFDSHTQAQRRNSQQYFDEGGLFVKYNSRTRNTSDAVFLFRVVVLFFFLKKE